VGLLGLYIHCALSIIHRPHHLKGSTVPQVFFFDQYYIIYYSVYNLVPNLIERLELKWFSVFSVGDHIRVWILFHFIILFYLVGLFEIIVCPNGLLLWPLIGTEKVGSSPLASGWYKESPICYYILFFFHFADSYLLLVI
jgi:hypothetical protein